jgi:hypothetical protein
VPVNEVVKMLNEKNTFNFTIHLNTFTKLLGSSSAAFAVISAILKMKEHEYSSSKEKKDVASMVSSMKQQVHKSEDTNGECCGENDDESTNVDASSVETAQARKNKTNTQVKLNLNQTKIPWVFDE